MPRPVSWLPQLHAIRKSVGISVRSHYERRDLELLFKLQPSAAGKLLEILPTVTIGKGKLVERNALAKFLEEVHAAEDVPALLDRKRTEKRTTSRRRPRYLVTPLEQGGMKALPDTIALERGSVSIRFDTVLELCEALHALAEVVECEEFERKFAVTVEASGPDPGAEMRAMFAHLRKLEEAYLFSKPEPKRTPQKVSQEPVWDHSDAGYDTNPPLSAITF